MDFRKFALFAVTAAGLGISWGALAAPPENPSTKPPAEEQTQERDKWMQIKLRSSQAVFAGLTNGDFKAIEDNARRMLVLNFLEQWSGDRKDFSRRSEYEGQLHAFEFATKELVRNGRDKNIDGALDAYLQLSKSCVQCHKIIRDTP